MPASATQFKNRLITLQPCSHDGQFVLQESAGTGFPTSGNVGGGGNFKENAYGMFSFCTGGSNGLLSDIASSGVPASGVFTQTLIDPRRCPSGMRPYITRLDIDIQGAVSWGISSPTTGIPYFAITDTSAAANPLVVLPFNSLKGMAELTFPNTETTIPLLLGPSTVGGPVGAPVTTWTWSSSAYTVTAAANVFPNSATCMVGVPVQIVDGTGKGQTALVQTSASNSQTVLYLGSSAFPVAPDSTSVLAVWWQPLQAYGSTTSLTVPNGSGTPFTQYAFDNGFNVVGMFGSGSGSVRPISGNTTAGVLSLAYALNNAMSATATLGTLTMLQVTTDNQLNGATDMAVGDKWTVSAVNSGLQVVVNGQGGTSPVGSNVRIYGEGYWGA